MWVRQFTCLMNDGEGIAIRRFDKVFTGKSAKQFVSTDSATRQGMKHTQEAIDKMKAHKFSDEHRRKLSEAAKQRKRKSSSGEIK